MATTQTQRALFFIPGMPPDTAQARYRALVKVLHPDVPTGDLKLMQRLNLEFEALQRGLLLPPVDAEPERPIPPADPLGSYFEYLRKEAANQIRALPPFYGIHYEIDSLQRLIIAAGDSFDHKEALKRLGFHWAPERRAWVKEVYA